MEVINLLKSKELRAKAWDSLKGKYWLAFVSTIITGLICSVGSFFVSYGQDMSEIPSMVDQGHMDAVATAGAVVIAVMALVVVGVGCITNVFISNPAIIGSCNYYIKNVDSKPSLVEVFSGYKTRYGRNIKTMLLVDIKLVLWSILFLIPGIIKSFEYAIIPYILADDAEISSKDAFKKAKQMMKGNKWRMFKLEFSFIGWFMLCVLTLGIGTFFLMPYVSATFAEFYMELKNK